MQKIGFVICAGVGLVSCPTAIAHSGRPTCPTHVGHVIAANAEAEIFRASSIEDPYVYACAFGHSKEYGLGFRPVCGAPVCQGIRHELLAGTVVVYESFFTGMEEGSWYIAARDLRTGRVIRHVATGAALKPAPRNVGVGPVVGLVAKKNGSVAWIATDYERSTPSTSTSREVSYYDVYASDNTGTRLLAQGFNVNPSSLALAGSTVYWRQGGQAMSTALN